MESAKPTYYAISAEEGVRRALSKHRCIEVYRFLDNHFNIWGNKTIMSRDLARGMDIKTKGYSGELLRTFWVLGMLKMEKKEGKNIYSVCNPELWALAEEVICGRLKC